MIHTVTHNGTEISFTMEVYSRNVKIIFPDGKETTITMEKPIFGVLPSIEGTVLFFFFEEEESECSPTAVLVDTKTGKIISEKESRTREITRYK